LKHTGLCFKTASGTDLLLEKTADMGVWIRKKFSFESIKTWKSRSVSVPSSFDCLMNKIHDKVDLDPKMTPRSTCQHFSRNAFNIFLDTNTPSVLCNQRIFDFLERIKYKEKDYGWLFGEGEWSKSKYFFVRGLRSFMLEEIIE
jgi:hypothetical protein